MAGSCAVSCAVMRREDERERPWMTSISGRKRDRVDEGSEGRSQEGRRLPETPGGRRSAAEASRTVYQAAGLIMVVFIVFWMRQLELYLPVLVQYQSTPS